MNDTSHYAECLTLMNKYKRLHLKRLVILAILLVTNFYVHALTFGVKYAGESFQSAIMANGEREISQSVDMSVGIGALVFIAAVMGIGFVIFKKVQSDKIKIGYVIGAVAFLGISTLVQQGQAANASGAEGKIGVSHLAFGMGMLTLLLSLVCLILALFGDHQHPKLYAALIVLLIIGGVTDCYHWLITALMVCPYLFAIPEYRKMNWILKQPGYPYFNERFQEQLLHSEYEPMHKLDNKNHGVMAGVDNDTESAASRIAPSGTNIPTAAYTLDTNGAPDEMPGISDIFEHPVPLPEPELPDVDAIPAPVWNAPDSNASPDALTDTSTILSDFPEIAGDIPDLPELPDIPQI